MFLHISSGGERETSDFNHFVDFEWKNKIGKLILIMQLIGDDEKIVIDNSRLCNASLLKTPVRRSTTRDHLFRNGVLPLLFLWQGRSHYSMPWCYNLDVGLKMNGMNGIIDIIVTFSLLFFFFFIIHFRCSSITRTIGVAVWKFNGLVI